MFDASLSPFDRCWPIEQAVQLACLLEATAPKIGNVHPGASFSDMHFGHFLASAIAIGRAFTEVSQTSVGSLVLRAEEATRAVTQRNTNLGTLLLFAPLAKAHGLAGHIPGDLRCRVAWVLERLQPEDSQSVYAAIRAARPGGLGNQSQHDISAPAPDDLLVAMATVADIDAVARQYTNGFADIFERLVPWLQDELMQTGQSLEALCRLQLRWLAHEPDGLIVRKLGADHATLVQQQAADLLAESLAQSTPVSEHARVQQLDRFLRAAGHRANPGTTADLIATAALVLLLGVDG